MSSSPVTDNPMIAMTSISSDRSRSTSTTLDGDISDNNSIRPTNAFVSKNVKTTNLRKILSERALFDSVGTQFHASIFFFQFFGHLFPPFLYAFTQNRAAQGFASWSLSSIRFNILSPLCFYVMLFCFWASTHSDKEILGYSYYFPAMFFIVHRTTVALKYATMSKTEYERFMTCKDPDLINCYVFQLQVLSGWFAMDNLVLTFELSAASARIGAKINEIYFRISSNFDHDPLALSQYRHWNAFLRGHERIDVDAKPAREMKKLPNGDYGVSVFDTCAAIIRQATEEHRTLNDILAKTVTVSVCIMVFVLYIPLFQHAHELNRVGLVTAYLITATVLTWDYATVFFFFIYVGILDVGRFLKMAQTLHRMIRLSDLMIDGDVSVNGETVNECERLRAQRRLDALMAICDTKHDPMTFVNSDGNACYDMENKEQMEQFNITSMGGKFAMRDTTTMIRETTTRDATSTSTTSSQSKKKSVVLGEQVAENFDYAMTPRVDLLQSENATAWIYARLTIQYFGERFRYRTDTYMAFMGLIILAIMLIVLLSIASSPDRQAAYTSQLFILAFVTVSLYIAIIAGVTVLGTAVNTELTSHCRTLSAHMTQIKNRLQRFVYDPCPEHHFFHESDLNDALLSVERITRVAEINNALKPFRVFGMPAQSGLTMSLLTTALSFYSVIFSMYSTTTDGQVTGATSI